MYTLFISTYDKLVLIAILKDGKLINKSEIESSHNHSEVVMPTIKDIFIKSNIDVKDINEIIVVNGPGSFTGVRIGVTIAKSLAFVLNVKIKTITSLECIAVSVDKNTNKLAIISDLKGKYIGYFNKDNLLLEDFKYLKNNEYLEYKEDKLDYIIDSYSFDIEKIYNYLSNKEYINPHLVNPIYIKNIEVLNDK